jgi:hypothetical protein
MQQIILEYNKPQGSGSIGTWAGNVGGREMKLVRVVAGLAIPKDDRQAAALVILGELFRNFQPADFYGLSARVGTWPEIKSALQQACRDLKPERIIVQDEPTRKLIYPLTDALVGAPVVPSCYAAPAHALTELGRQNVEQLIGEGRLHIERLLDTLDSEKDQADAALRLAVNYALEFTAFYPAGKPRGPIKYGRLLGTDGL